MRESIKGVCLLLLLIAIVVGVCVWIDDRPTLNVWRLRWATVAIAVIAFSVFTWVHFRRDKIADYLGEIDRSYFNRKGLCFSFDVKEVDGICHVHAYFQNQFVRPCRGQIALRADREFYRLLGRVETFYFDIDCPGAAFGVATLPIGVPESALGRFQAFEVGADVVFPEGRGRQLRFQDGIHLRQSTKFNDVFGNLVAITAALGGTWVSYRRPTLVMQLPANCRQQLPCGAAQATEVLRKLDELSLALRQKYE